MNRYDIELLDILKSNKVFYESPFLQRIYNNIGHSEVKNSRLLLDAILVIEESRLKLQSDYVELVKTGTVIHKVYIAKDGEFRAENISVNDIIEIH